MSESAWSTSSVRSTAKAGTSTEPPRCRRRRSGSQMRARPWDQRAPLRSRVRPPARVIMKSAASVDRMEHPTFDLTDQVALVTGASRGIGHDLVLALAAAGATVAAGARSAADVTGLVEQVRAAGGQGEDQVVPD